MENNNKTEKILYFVVGILILVVFLLVLIPTSKQPNNSVQSVILEQKNISLLVGDTYNIKYFVSPSNAINSGVTYRSNNESIATVDTNGRVYAVSPGTTSIRVTSSNGVYSDCIINVTKKEIPVRSVSLNQSDIEINVGESINLKATIEPYDSTNHELIWTSSDDSVVSVNNGKITGKKNGTALITVKTSNGKMAICDVTVGVSIETIKIEEKPIKMVTGSEYDLKVSISPINATEKVSFVSGSPSIVEVSSSGKLTAKSSGTAIITVKAPNGVKDTVQVDVRAKGVQITSALNTSLNTHSFNIKGKVIAFGSDYQGSNRKSNFKAILNNLNNNNINPSLISILGDYLSSGHALEDSLSGLRQANSLIKDVFPNAGSLFIQGNHDPASNYLLTKTGGYEADNYVIYAINEDDYPSSSSTSTSKISKIVSNLDQYLANLVEWNVKKPVFVITHVPLHYSSRGDNRTSYLIVDTLNKYGDKLDIIFMFGHNHSSKYDDCLGGGINYIKKGSNMKHFASSSTKYSTLKFTYMNAGYIGVVNNTNGQVSCSGSKVKSVNTLTMSVFKINDQNIVIERYSSSAKVFTDTIERIN